ncbi:MAG: hypothetical protein ACYC1D_18070 [Acidimicrobiales bacterium]
MTDAPHATPLPDADPIGENPATTGETTAPDAQEATPVDAEGIDALVAAWKAELDGQVSVPAAQVQDRLLDLWGHLPVSDSRTEVERWLTETLARHLYAATDIDARLEQVLALD